MRNELGGSVGRRSFHYQEEEDIFELSESYAWLSGREIDPAEEEYDEQRLAWLRKEKEKHPETAGAVDDLIDIIQEKRDRRNLEAAIAYTVRKNPEKAEMYGDRFWQTYETVMERVRRRRERDLGEGET